MGRKATVRIRALVYTITTDIPKSQARDVAAKFDDYNFAFYFEDKSGRLSFVYQPFGSVKGIDIDIESLKRNKKPSINEIFDQADIVNERTGEVYAELENVDIFGILDGIREVFHSYKVAN